MKSKTINSIQFQILPFYHCLQLRTKPCKYFVFNWGKAIFHFIVIRFIIQAFLLKLSSLNINYIVLG
jgi:hypothetical protein